MRRNFKPQNHLGQMKPAELQRRDVSTRRSRDRAGCAYWLMTLVRLVALKDLTCQSK
jgi:hypothetical protein